TLRQTPANQANRIGQTAEVVALDEDAAAGGNHSPDDRPTTELDFGHERTPKAASQNQRVEPRHMIRYVECREWLGRGAHFPIDAEDRAYAARPLHHAKPDGIVVVPATRVRDGGTPHQQGGQSDEPPSATSSDHQLRQNDRGVT